MSDSAKPQDQQGQPPQQVLQPTAGAPFSEDGVDLTLIRWMLGKTPAERLQVVTEGARSMLALLNAVRA